MVEDRANSDRYITEIEAAEKYGLSLAWFRRQRWAGGGPPYVKLGRAVRYQESTLDQWFQSRVVHSTSERAGGVA